MVAALSPRCGARPEVWSYFHTALHRAESPDDPRWYGACGTSECASRLCGSRLSYQVRCPNGMGYEVAAAGEPDFPFCVPDACAGAGDLAAVAQAIQADEAAFLHRLHSCREGGQCIEPGCLVEASFEVDCSPWGASVEATGHGAVATRHDRTESESTACLAAASVGALRGWLPGAGQEFAGVAAPTWFTGWPHWLDWRWVATAVLALAAAAAALAGRGRKGGAEVLLPEATPLHMAEPEEAAAPPTPTDAEVDAEVDAAVEELVAELEAEAPAHAEPAAELAPAPALRSRDQWWTEPPEDFWASRRLGYSEHRGLQEPGHEVAAALERHSPTATAAALGQGAWRHGGEARAIMRLLLPGASAAEASHGATAAE